MTAFDDVRVETEGRVERPLFLADWCEMFFIHLEVPADQLRRHVPFEPDLFDGRAYVSLVAFTQKNLRPAFGGRIGAALLAPLAEHAFLNLRTYVRVGETRGIYFLSEWIPNRLAQWIGPRAYGLPYRLGRLDYHNDSHRCRGSVRDHRSIMQYAARPQRFTQRASAGTLNHFLLERYSAFTHRHGITRRFDVEHERWSYSPATISTFIPDLLLEVLPWIDASRLACAQFSTGVREVKIGRPQIVRGLTVCSEHCARALPGR